MVSSFEIEMWLRMHIAGIEERLANHTSEKADDWLIRARRRLLADLLSSQIRNFNTKA